MAKGIKPVAGPLGCSRPEARGRAARGAALLQPQAAAVLSGAALCPRRRTVFHALLHPLLARLPAWLVPAATAAAVYLREALIYCTAAGVALVASWAIWKLVEAREALQPAGGRGPGAAAYCHALSVPRLQGQLQKHCASVAGTATGACGDTSSTHVARLQSRACCRPAPA